MKAQGNHWKIIKLCFGFIFLATGVSDIVLLHRMAIFRQTLEYPESGLFLANALALLPMALCFIMALWCFLSAWLRLKNRLLKIALIVAAFIIGAGCLLCYVVGIVTINNYYAQAFSGW